MFHNHRDVAEVTAEMSSSRRRRWRWLGGNSVPTSEVRAGADGDGRRLLLRRRGA